MYNNPKKNTSGCSDLTAYEAIKNVSKETEKFNKMLRTIYDVCDLSGYKIENRIIFSDKKTGKIWD